MALPFGIGQGKKPVTPGVGSTLGTLAGTWDPNYTGPAPQSSSINDYISRNAAAAQAEIDRQQAELERRQAEIRDNIYLSAGQKKQAYGALAQILHVQRRSRGALDMARLRADPVGRQALYSLNERSDMLRQARDTATVPEYRDAINQQYQTAEAQRQELLKNAGASARGGYLPDWLKSQNGRAYIREFAQDIATQNMDLAGVVKTWATDQEAITKQQNEKAVQDSYYANEPWYIRGTRGTFKGGWDLAQGVMNWGYENFARHPLDAAAMSAERGGGLWDNIRSAGAGMMNLTNLLDPTDFAAQNANLTTPTAVEGYREKGLFFEGSNNPIFWKTPGERSATTLAPYVGWIPGSSTDRHGIPTWNGMNVLSTTLDAAYDIVLDPLSYADTALKPFQAIGSGDRAAFLLTRRGESLTHAAETALQNFDDPARLAKGLGIEFSTAEKALAARDSLGGGMKAGVKVLEDAFVAREWNPTVTLRRQAAAAAGVEGAFGARGIPIIYGHKPFVVRPGLARAGMESLARDEFYRDGWRIRRTVRPGLGMGDNASANILARMPSFVREDGARAVGDLGGVVKDPSLPFKAVAPEDFWQRYAAPEVANLDQMERWARLGESQDPAFLLEVTRENARLRALNPNLLDNPLAEQSLKRLEVVKALLKGEGGARAQLMAEVELTQGIRGLGFNGAVKSAVSDDLSIVRRTAIAEQLAAARTAERKSVEVEVERVKRLRDFVKAQEESFRSTDNRTRAEMLKDYGAQLKSLNDRLSVLKREESKYKQQANPFKGDRVKWDEEPVLKVPEPRSAKTIAADIDKVEHAIAEKRAGLGVAFDAAKADARKALEAEVDQWSRELRINMAKQDALRAQRGRAGLAFGGGIKTAQELKDEFRAIEAQLKEAKVRLGELNAGRLATPAMADLAAEARVLGDPLAQDAKVINAHKTRLMNIEVELSNLEATADQLTAKIDEVKVPLPIGDALAYFDAVSLTQLDLNEIRQRLDAAAARRGRLYFGNPGKNPELFNKLKAAEDRLAARWRKASFARDDALALDTSQARELATIAELSKQLDDVHASMNALITERMETQSALTKLEASTAEFVPAPRLKPVPMADWEVERLASQVGLDIPKLRGYEALDASELERRLIAEQDFLAKVSGDAVWGSIDTWRGYDVPGNSYRTEDVLRAAANVEAYSTILGRVADRRHPLIAQLNDLKAELAGTDAQRAARAGEEISRNLDQRLETALATIGVSDLKRLDPTNPADIMSVRSRIRAIDDQALQDKAMEALAEVESKGKGLNTLAARVELALRDSDIRAQAAFLLDASTEAERAAAGLRNMKRFGLGPVSAMAKLGLSTIESVPPTALRWTSSANATLNSRNLSEDIERYYTRLGFDRVTISELKRAAAASKSEEEMYALVREGYARYEELMGLPKGSLTQSYDNVWHGGPDLAFGIKSAEGKTTRSGKFKVTDAELETDVQLVTQKRNNIPLLSPEDIERSAREWRAKNGDLYQRATSGARLAMSDKFVHGKIPLTAGKVEVGELAKGVHKFWKFAVVTNAPFIGLGAVAGFVSSDGDIGDRLRNAAKFGVIGMLGSVRYITRVVGVEEGLIRRSMARGFLTPEWVPGVAKRARRWGVDLPFRVEQELASGANPLHHIESKWLKVVDEGAWDAYGQSDGRFIDSWHRIVNYHINPETDDLARMALQGKLGLLPDWEGRATYWLTKDPDGILFMSRLKAARGGAETAEEAIARYSRAIDTYLPSDNLKRLRLANADLIDARIEHDDLKKLLKAGDAPAVVYGEKSWTIPKPWRVQELKRSWSQVYQRAVLEKPTMVANRRAMAEAIYGEEYRSLVKAGVSPAKARDLAEVVAVDKTNEVMFRISDESRFANKVDFIFPFQQPREELVRVYGKLIANNKANTLKATQIGANIFNDGKESGVFFQDQYGDWTMTVPGSVYLSRLFGTPNTGSNFHLKDVFFFLQNAGQGGAPVDFSDPVSGFGTLLRGTLPVPGGPFWQKGTRLVFNYRPDLEAWASNDPIGRAMFPFGTDGFIWRREARFMWNAMFETPFPLEVFSGDQAQKEIDRWQSTVMRELLYQNWVKAGKPHDLDPSLLPSDTELRSSMEGFWTMWAAMGGLVPAPTRPVFPGQDWAQAKLQEYKDKYGEYNGVGKFYEDYPVAATAFLTARTHQAADAPDDGFDEWLRRAGGEEFVKNSYQQRYRDYYTADEFRDFFKKKAEEQDVYRELNELKARYYATPEEKSQAFDDFYERVRVEHPNVNLRNRYDSIKQLNELLSMPPGVDRDRLINQWRKRFDVSPSEYNKLMYEAIGFQRDWWAESRPMDEIDHEVNAARLRGVDESRYVERNLNPAEQAKYWQNRMLHVYYDFQTNAYGDKPKQEMAGTVWDQYSELRYRLNKVYRDHPSLFQNDKPQTPYDKVLAKTKDVAYEGYYALNHSIGLMIQAQQEAYANKDYTTARMLTNRLAELYDMKKAYQSEFFRAIPDLHALQRDIIGNVVINIARTAGKHDLATKIEMDQLARMRDMGIDQYFVPFFEEANYYKAPIPVRKAYIADLINHLDNDPNSKYDGFGAYRWSYLTDFQKSILERNLPKDQVDAWKLKDLAWDDLKSGGSSKRRRSYHRRGGSVDGELSFAYSMFKQYNKRTGPEPAAYQEYLALPQDPGTRHKFLREHPEVAKWIADGPLANMPELERAMVINIMVKHGKFDGEAKSSDAVLEIAWARLQMDKYSQRAPGEVPPETYDLWMAMPTGEEKAQYLRDHPEISEWVRRGPMANMPDAYKDIVRDIMYRYGEWEQRQDPLGELLTQLGKTPKQLKAQFMAEHPELAEYLKATRSPEEQRMYDMANNYFSITDPAARRAYLSGHPDLLNWFSDQRQRRYENFLNQVAIFMGQNPEMFDAYLKRQTDIMQELVRRFAQMPLVREAPAVVKSQGENTGRRAYKPGPRAA